MQPSIPWSSSVSVFLIERTAIIHSLKCTVPFSFTVPLLSLAVTRCKSLPLVVTLCHLLHYSLSLVVIRCHSFSFVITRCHSLSLVVIRCHSLYYSLSLLSLVLPLVVTRRTTRCHSLSFVVTRCTDRLYFYKRSNRPIIW